MIVPVKFVVARLPSNVVAVTTPLAFTSVTVMPLPLKSAPPFTSSAPPIVAPAETFTVVDCRKATVPTPVALTDVASRVSSQDKSPLLSTNR